MLSRFSSTLIPREMVWTEQYLVPAPQAPPGFRVFQEVQGSLPEDVGIQKSEPWGI